ncbi:probable Hsp90 co-chaperone Cdc37 [Rhynchosporium agropyri]|uniref:Hsp90 chaperone protein kinase-targeting subunit n=1 Tax=Rhynchosporium agropyri TaxID=914238 RepID=A0A1E1K5C3_9HELO|nr:probable Hsp90 co-chaperone Cdc37 [Rhynchosporium agropyri]
MPVDYSKWDALELSDDSDIEVHPNVDKRSFIRAKQNQIHQHRFERKNQIETYKYERIINDGLLKRINALLTALQSHGKEAESRSPDELVFQAIMESVGASEDGDKPPPPPVGVHTQEKELPSYSKMMAALVDQVKAKVDEDKPADSERYQAYLMEIKAHQTKVEGLQKQLLVELNKLEVEEGKKITSEGLHDGFNSSHVSKADAYTPPEPKHTTTKKVQAVEVLNPHALAATDSDPQSSGADGDVDEPGLDKDDDEEEMEPTELGKAFSKIKMGDYRSCLQYISEHPQVLAERETDGLLVMAFNAAIKNELDFSKQCVHQGLLLQYCRALGGRDGVGMFFKRITTQGHQAQKVFFDDVSSTFTRIRVRAKELEKQRAQEEADGNGGVEQIQLHAVDPGTTINIKIPPATSEDPEEVEARKLFNAFPPGLQRALESGSLDEVNKVLGKMSVEEAEELVGQLGEGGMLSLEEQIIDATTEEGQQALKEFEEQERAAAKENAASTSKYSEDPE